MGRMTRIGTLIAPGHHAHLGKKGSGAISIIHSVPFLKTKSPFGSP